MKKSVLFFASAIVTAALVMVVSQGALAAGKGKKKRLNYAQAKAECLTENQSLAGKALQACIKKKQK